MELKQWVTIRILTHYFSPLIAKKQKTPIIYRQ